ncbi:nitroreductase family deazaflavin-dependent oxidoreductase [Dactylosporangium vinaceum]|uniref:Nitroreductase family deazaflavin-dependent oxidoreductase n=1 Tax=Dactylosporangium vinaceum TaxID=53362 RepID=A0ABV5M5V7_9ACTN|nr:nitroreductase family deazaflavin-dependent oxidoreductase [Dactylosporangium vinaceum]UAC01283.1 nitroreductase family deazaflavin-dependent oxidoreductase [Dactylosporangium vinaceum]
MSDWNTQIIEEFRANGGKVGGRFAGGTLLLIHHRGARTGVERVNPVAYLPDGERMVIVASAAGADKNPDWYHNLKANPDTSAEVGTETLDVRAEEILGDDYASTWERLVAVMPGFAEYQTKTSRRIPLIALTRR